MRGNDEPTQPAGLVGLQLEPGARCTVGQLRSRTRHLRNHIARNLEAMDTEAGARAAIRRSAVLQLLGELELTLAELRAHEAEHAPR